MLVDEDGWLDQAVRVPSAHQGGPIVPLLVVNHWTAGFSASGSVHALDVQGLSAHFVIDRDGGVIQTVSCNRRAHHAGASTWRGRSGCNGFSVGIEWCNLGPVNADGTAYGKMAPNPIELHSDGKWYETLSGAQIDAGRRLHKALAVRYPTIQAATDHATVSPGRKIDMIPWQGIVAQWGEAFVDRQADLPSTPKLSNGREPLHVRDIQAALVKAGYHIAVDGIIGAKTTAAIIAFQKSRGLLHVGVVNDETRAALGL